MNIRILVADAHALVREGLRRIVEEAPDIAVVALAEDGRDAVARAETLGPDVALIETALPRLSGEEAIRRIRAGGGPTRCIALAARESEPGLTRALRAGATGCLLKSAAPSELIGSIRTVAAGRTYLSPAVARRVIEAMADPEDRSASRLSLLTGREREVLQLIAEGLSNKEIAADLRLSCKTVDTHRANLMGKLEIRKASQLVRVAIQEGLVVL